MKQFVELTCEFLTPNILKTHLIVYCVRYYEQRWAKTETIPSRDLAGVGFKYRNFGLGLNSGVWDLTPGEGLTIKSQPISCSSLTLRIPVYSSSNLDSLFILSANEDSFTRQLNGSKRIQYFLFCEQVCIIINFYSQLAHFIDY